MSDHDKLLLAVLAAVFTAPLWGTVVFFVLMDLLAVLVVAWEGVCRVVERIRRRFSR